MDAQATYHAYNYQLPPYQKHTTAAEVLLETALINRATLQVAKVLE